MYSNQSNPPGKFTSPATDLMNEARSMVPEYPIASSKLTVCFAKRFMYRIFTYENVILNSLMLVYQRVSDISVQKWPKDILIFKDRIMFFLCYISIPFSHPKQLSLLPKHETPVLLYIIAHHCISPCLLTNIYQYHTISPSVIILNGSPCIFHGGIPILQPRWPHCHHYLVRWTSIAMENHGKSLFYVFLIGTSFFVNGPPLP